jgi:hypothetical protein
MTYYRRPPPWFYSGQEPPKLFEPPKSDSGLDEAYLAGKSAAQKAATDASRRENRPDARALAAAIAAVCARYEPPWTPEPGKKFAELILPEVRGVLKASQDPKIQKKLHGGWPYWRTISRLIEDYS